MRALLKRRPRLWKAFAALGFVALLAVGGGAYVIGHQQPSWGEVDGYIALRFSDVQHIETRELADQLERENAPLLLDIRAPQEYAVSHLPTAINVPPDEVLDFAERELTGLDRRRAIVVYCSVGVRSAQAADELKLLGFSQVRNLQGSIFKWANEGRPLVGGDRVHPFDTHWGRLLRADLHTAL